MVIDRLLRPVMAVPTPSILSYNSSFTKNCCLSGVENTLSLSYAQRRGLGKQPVPWFDALLYFSFFRVSTDSYYLGSFVWFNDWIILCQAVCGCWIHKFR